MFYHGPSGLYLTAYRPYDPRTSRWLSREPLGEAYGINRYAYAFNDPVALYDPDGLSVYGTIGAGLGGVIGGIGGELIEPLGGGIPGVRYGSALGRAIGEAINVIILANSVKDDVCKEEKASGPDSAAGGAEPPPPEGDNNDRGDKQKKGKPGRNVDQNKRVDDAAREAGLDKPQRRQLGRYIEQGSRKYGEDYSYSDILDAAERIKGGERLINIK